MSLISGRGYVSYTEDISVKLYELFEGHTVTPIGFEILTAVSTKMAFFWVVVPCSLVEVYQRFRGPCCLHHQSDRSDAVGRKDL
jgi:hypothetical protein